MDETLDKAILHFLGQLEQGDDVVDDLLLIEVDWGERTPPVTDEQIEVTFQGARWPLVFTTSELVLRRTLCRSADGRAILVFCGEGGRPAADRFEIPLDIQARAHRKTSHRLGMGHRLYAVTGRDWPPEVDYAEWRPSIERHFDALVRGAAKVPLTNWDVTRTDLELMLVDAAFDLTVERCTAPQLLAGLVGPQRRTAIPPTELETSLLQGQLRLHQVADAEILLWAAREEPGRAEMLIRTAVMMGAERWAQFEPSWGGLNNLRALLVGERQMADQDAKARVIALGTEALSHLHHETRKAIVRDAERDLADVLPPGSYNPWFPGVLAQEIERVAERLSRQSLDAVSQIAQLKDHLFASQYEVRLAVLHGMAALLKRWEAAKLQIEEVTGTAGWATWYAQTGSRLDLAALKLMAQQYQGTELDAPIRRLLDRYWRWRDGLNAAFAEEFLAHYEAALHDRDADVFGIHRILGWVVHPLLQQGQRVLLLVIDGMGWAAFWHLLDQWATLSSEQNPPIYVRQPRPAFSLLPSVTSVARKGLFLGALPTDRLDDEDTYEQKARTSEVKALEQACREYTVKFYNKTNLEGGEQVLNDLQFHGAHLVAVILNGIDDDIRSTTTMVRLPRLAEDLGPLVNIVRSALGAGWEVVVTADHGHTWHRDKALRRGRVVSGGGERFAPAGSEEATPPGAITTQDPHIVRLQDGQRAILLTATGAYYGHIPRRGYHGGASLEEVVVPCAFLTREKPSAPAGEKAAASESAEDEGVGPTGYDLGGVVLTLPDGRVTSLEMPFTLTPREIRLLQALARMGEADEAELRRTLQTRRIAGPLASLRERLAAEGLDYIEYKGTGPGGAIYRFRTELVGR
jgi:hypothetical protein